MSVAGIDIVFGIIILFMGLRAAIRGFVKELLGTGALILGVVVAMIFSGAVAGIIDRYMGPSIWSQIIAFLGLFLIVYLVVKLFESALNRLIERIHLDQLDHALGLFLGLIEGLVVVFVLLLLIQIQPFFAPESLITGSLAARLLVPLMPIVSEFLLTRRIDV